MKIEIGKVLAMMYDNAFPYLPKKTIERVTAALFTRGFKDEDLAAIDEIVYGFMTTYRVPGMSIAIARDGRLVYAKGFGQASEVFLKIWPQRPGTGPEYVEINSEDVSIWNVFRIASVSKPITAVAIFKLVEQGKLNLSDTVFGVGALLGTDFGFGSLPAEQDPDSLRKITVQHLLEHTSGGWPNDSSDPMFAQLTFDQSQLIRWVLENRRLDHVPGTVWSYSNFGYCLLGRVIEKVTGQTYAAFVLHNVLEPCGIRNMHIAGVTLADRRSDEVVYYAQPYFVKFNVEGQVVGFARADDDPYSIPVARMDSHGGWLASAVDLVRFVVHVDGLRQPNILDANTINTMTTPTTAREIGGDAPSYAKGWAVHRNGDGTWWHAGSLPGTTSLVVRSPQGFCWAALANTHRANSAMNDDLDSMMWNVRNAVSEWPDHDLFRLYDDPWSLVTVATAEAHI
ncbi:hypothetical protein WJ78_24470 [Burkholderia ubonensis]|uniref:serine hydrolase domain-containing protein n=1 Tax=Burkholderia ubonensis TaxID=101571 RepID=UPI000759FF28|nr:serine hydrolase domain-containing protein [Burkholderia ubonensis]KVO60444.1 hypothetical protein WJ78_24470 [Burkholderia ubonensis]KVP91209.1 hypothetical protein WJ97_03565 [Burkholderia ubonensis]OJB44994.1 hypothetical protein BGV57_06035 [Burkholderia ubonensis]